MKELYVTRGTYVGRILQLEDSVAASALADNWAIEIPDAGITSPEDGTDLTVILDRPQSLLDFEDAINRGGTSTDPSTASGEPTPPPPDGNGGGGGGGDVAPTLTSLDPATAVLNDPDFTLHVHGSGFTASSVIVFAGQDEPIVFISATEITTIVKPSLPWGAVTVPVRVRNGTEESAPLDFTFTEAA